MKVLVLGATGLLGSAMLRRLAESETMEVFGTIRSDDARKLFDGNLANRLRVLRDVQNDDGLQLLFDEERPDVVVNCVYPSRKALIAGDPLQVIPICALLPHRLAQATAAAGARLIHISTDGVFSGSKGGYTEEDVPDAKDVYGLSKYLGELKEPHTFTIRTSIIGHE